MLNSEKEIPSADSNQAIEEKKKKLYGFLPEIISVIRDKNLHHDYDAVGIIVGKERKGKSTLMLHMADEYDAETPIDNIGLTPREFVIAITTAKQGAFVCFDEAGDGLMSADTMTLFSRDLVRAYQVIGASNYFTILILPNFFMLNKYFRKHRVKFLIEVYARGNFSFYGEEEIKQIIKKGEKDENINVVSPMFRGSFPKYDGRLWKEYQEKKKKKVQESKDTLNELWGIQTKLSLMDACKFLGISYPKLRELIDLGRIKSETSYNNKEYILREDLLQLGSGLRAEIQQEKEAAKKRRMEALQLKREMKKLGKKVKEIKEQKKEEENNAPQS